MRTVVNSSPRRVCTERVSLRFRQKDIDAQDVGRQLRLDALVDSLAAGGLPDAAMGLEQFLAAPLRHLVEMRGDRVESLDDLADEVARLLRRDVASGSASSSRRSLVAIKPLGILR